MLYKDEILLEKAYHKIYEDNNPFKPASEDEIEDRKQQQLRLANQKMHKYIDGGMKGDLDLEGSPATQMPGELTQVDGDLELANSKFTSLPDTLKYVSGDMCISMSEIEYLPDDLKVGGSLTISYSQIQHLPKNLYIGDSLDMSMSNIESLPDDLTVHGTIWVDDSVMGMMNTIDEIRAMYPLFRPDQFRA